MSEWTPLAADWWQRLALLLSLGLPGLPEGTTDPQQLLLVPQDAVIAVTWDGRGAGTLNAPGYAGALADPEIRRAVEALQTWSESSQNKADATMVDHAISILEQGLKYPGCLYVAVHPATETTPARWEGAIVLQPGAEKDAALESLRTHLPAWMLVDAQAPGPKSFTTGLIKFQQLDTRFIWSIGDPLPGMVQRLSTGTGGLAEQTDYQLLSQTVQVEHTGARVWLRIPEILPPAPGLSAPVRQLLAPVSSWAVLGTLGLEQQQVVARAAVRCPPAILAQRGTETPIPNAAWTRIPADAQFVAAIQCRLDTVLQHGLSYVESQLPERPEPGTLWRRLETELGVDLARDVLPAFGETWLISSAPSTGGPLGLGPVFSLNVTDPQAAYTVFTQAMIRLQQSLPDDPFATTRLTTELFEDRMLYCVQSTDAQLGRIAPCFCITDRELLITLQPQTMRAHLRFVSRNGPSFAERTDLPGTIPATAEARIFIDSPAWTAQLWPLVPYVINTSLNQQALRDLGIDASVWPSSSAMLAYSQPTTATIARTDWGWTAELRNPMSLAAPVIAVAAMLPALQQPTPSTLPNTITPELGQPAGLTIDLGTAEGDPATPATSPVVPAVAETPASPAPREAWRSWVPGLIRAVTPDDVEMLIPDEALRSIEAGPTPERIRRRNARKNARSTPPVQAESKP